MRLNIELSEGIEEKFKSTVYLRYGMKKGNLKKAVEEAIEIWIEKGDTK